MQVKSSFNLTFWLKIPNPIGSFLRLDIFPFGAAIELDPSSIVRGRTDFLFCLLFHEKWERKKEHKSPISDYPLRRLYRHYIRISARAVSPKKKTRGKKRKKNASRVSGSCGNFPEVTVNYSSSKGRERIMYRYGHSKRWLGSSRHSTMSRLSASFCRRSTAAIGTQ